MANHKSARKRARQSVKRRLRNKHFKSRMHTLLKNARGLIAQGAQDKIDESLKKVTSTVQRLASKGIIHKNKADRTLSRIYRQVSSTLKSKTA